MFRNFTENPGLLKTELEREAMRRTGIRWELVGEPVDAIDGEASLLWEATVYFGLEGKERETLCVSAHSFMGTPAHLHSATVFNTTALLRALTTLVKLQSFQQTETE